MVSGGTPCPVTAKKPICSAASRTAAGTLVRPSAVPLRKGARSMRGTLSMLVFCEPFPSNEHAHMKLERKVAVVTGAGIGIGKAIATALGHEGARIVVADLANAEASAAELSKAGIEAIGVKVDITNEADVAKMAAA